MKNPSAFIVRRVEWRDASEALRAVRKTVFVEEQKVPEELEWDGRDEQCVHVLAQTLAGEAIGTGRLLPDGHIGRMAVLKGWRGRGVGSALLRELICAAREQGHRTIELSAQTHALWFYRRHGFEAHGGEYLDAGIPHRTMRLALKPTRGTSPRA